MERAIIELKGKDGRKLTGFVFTMQSENTETGPWQKCFGPNGEPTVHVWSRNERGQAVLTVMPAECATVEEKDEPTVDVNAKRRDELRQLGAPDLDVIRAEYGIVRVKGITAETLIASIIAHENQVKAKKKV